MRGEESSSDLTTVRVLTLSIEDVIVQVNVVHVDGTVEGDGDHLGNLAGLDVAGDTSSVSRAETIGENALGRVAVGGTVRVSLHSCTGKYRGLESEL